MTSLRFRLRLVVSIAFSFALISLTRAQIENVPVSNPVYEFLDRMGVRGFLPLYSNVMIPLPRQEVADHLRTLEKRKAELTPAESSYLEKFEQEFMHEIDPAKENVSALLNGGSLGDIFSDKEKYLYLYEDSSATLYAEFLGVLDHRRITGDSYGDTHASFEQHGGRVRGTLKDRLGYFAQATNGTLYGDKTFALSDPRLRGNVKFNNLNSPYFDFTQAYLRADLSWFNLEFGREYTLVGTGYSDRLLLSDNAPVMDFIKLDARYKSIRFIFMQASLVADSAIFPGTSIQEPAGSNKYLALHRVQFSLFDRANFGLSEMIIYQRFSPDFAYLNPINFYKSSEHSLRDRDNAFLNFDLEIFPAAGCKLYGTWLIDDIDFSKIGTGWWGNEFGWQGGIALTNLAGVNDVDGVIEYTRIEPYVYSNRVNGNDYTNDNIGLGHHLEPNSDEWFIQLAYRPTKRLRCWLAYTRTRHGENIVADGQVIRNVGGDYLQGHRDIDSDTAIFLDGNLVKSDRVQLRAAYEPYRNIMVTGVYEFRRSEDVSTGGTATDHYASVQLQFDY